MRKHLEKSRNQTNRNLFIIGCGFFIVTLISLYFIGFSKKYFDLMGLTYNELKQTDKLIIDDEIYDFMNGVLMRNLSENDSSNFLKIICFSIGNIEDIRNVINELPDSLIDEKQKIYLQGQLSNDKCIWDDSKLKGAWLLTPSELENINQNDSTDFWKEFRAKYGNYGKHKFSKPIFNKELTLAIILHSGQGGWLHGSEEVKVYIKIDNKWTLYKKIILWIS